MAVKLDGNIPTALPGASVGASEIVENIANLLERASDTVRDKLGPLLREGQKEANPEEPQGPAPANRPLSIFNPNDQYEILTTGSPEQVKIMFMVIKPGELDKLEAKFRAENPGQSLRDHLAGLGFDEAALEAYDRRLRFARPGVMTEF